MTQLSEAPSSIERTGSHAKRKHEVDPSRHYATLTFLRGSIVSLAIAFCSGLLSAFYYIPGVAEVYQKLGIQFTSLRPVHTTFAAAFIFLGGVAVVHRYLEDVAGPMGAAEKRRIRAQVILWGIAGAGILTSVLGGVFSGREYMGFHPIFSVPILLGWILFSWNTLSHIRKGFLHRPMHVTMWGVGLLFFIYTFVEQHAWLIPSVFSDPLMDLRLQWKATGTLVGSFNLFVYGTLYYIGAKISGNESYAHSRLAYALFGVGLLNSFTNFGHHTYHVPQSSVVKWVSFLVSMTEIILLARVVWDIAAMVKARIPEPPCSIQYFLASAKWWTSFILASSILISIPPINALIHGTTVVMAHGMGAEIGIDGMVLFAAATWILHERRSNRELCTESLTCDRYRRWIIGLNLSVASMIAWLTLSGVFTAMTRYKGLAPPEFIHAYGPMILAFTGSASAYFLARLTICWLRLLFAKRPPDSCAAAES